MKDILYTGNPILRQIQKLRPPHTCIVAINSSSTSCRRFTNMIHLNGQTTREYVFAKFSVVLSRHEMLYLKFKYFLWPKLNQ